MVVAHIEDVLLEAVAQEGKPYIFGAEAKASDPNPKAFDCSELVEWACARAGVVPTVPDGAFNQYAHCKAHDTLIPVEQARLTRGALMWVATDAFLKTGKGSGRNAIVHVVFSLGDGTTVEARGKAWGIGTWPSAGRFDFAALIPGVDYTPGHRQITEAAQAPVGPITEDHMGIALVPRSDQKGYDIYAHAGWTQARLVADGGELPELLRAHGLPENTDLPKLAHAGTDPRVILAGQYAMDRVPKVHV